MRVLVLGIALAVAYPVCGQDFGERVIVSSSIGDTLRPEQSDYLQLLPSIRGFKWAVFYLVHDSVLNARVHYVREAASESDTVVENCGTLLSVHARIASLGRTQSDSAEILMKDGSKIRGTILGETERAFIVYTPRLGTLRIARGNVEKAARLHVRQSGDYFGVVVDPNLTRAFLMPTATTLPAGKGYVGDYELIFLTAAVGVTDWLMVNGGTLLIPLPTKDMVFNYGFKARLYETRNEIEIAAGLQMMRGLGFEGSAGIVYGIASAGDQDRKLNLAIGNAFESHAGSATLWGVSGDYRMTESIKLMAEIWFLEHASWSPLVIGVRFFGSRLSGDLGLLYPIGSSLSSPIGIPMASITYAF